MSRVLGNGHALVLRGARHSNVSGLPVHMATLWQHEPAHRHEAVVAMRLFLEQYYARAGNDLETLIADISIESDGQPLDPPRRGSTGCAASGR